MSQAKLSFYGVRGSHPVARPQPSRYGGNTTSLLLEKDDKIIIFDAGTGIIHIGAYLKKHKPHIRRIDIFLTHLHFDHIMGLPFFEPLYDPAYSVQFYCDNIPERGIRFEETIYSLFLPPLSPVGKEGIKAALFFRTLNPAKPEAFMITPDLRIDYIKQYEHPLSGVLHYRIAANGRTAVFATDIESVNGFGPEYLPFVQGVDFFIHDSHYLDGDYIRNFGHSTVTMAVNNALKAQAKTLYLFHFNPDYQDSDIEKMLLEARGSFPAAYLSEERQCIVL